MTDRPRIELPDGSYIRSTGASSAKFGPCELCGQHAAEVFLRVGPGGSRSVRFGHETCLRGQARARAAS